MILRNPKNGADIKRDFDGMVWEIKVGETLKFKDKVGQQLKEVYGFLEEVNEAVKLSVKEVLEDGKTAYQCSACDYVNEYKVAVVSHQRKHKGKEIKFDAAKSTGQVIANPSISEARAQRKSMDAGIPEGEAMDKDGIPWYGEGYSEVRNDPIRRAGRFGLV